MSRERQPPATIPPDPEYDLRESVNWKKFIGDRIMAKANAEQKQKEFNAAAKKLAAKGITKPPKHVPGESAPGVKAVWPESGNAGAPAQAASNLPKETKMTTTTKDTDTRSLAEKDAEVMAKKAAAKQAAIEAKAKEKAEAKEKADAAKLEKEQKKAADAAAKKAEREAARAAKPAVTPTESMSALKQRVQEGKYVKSMTGQLRSTDDVAVALDAVPPANVVKLGMLLFKEENKYAALNVGQQSMNYRNRMRGAIGKGTFTLEALKEARDANNFATAEDELRAKEAAKAEKAAAKAKAEVEKKAKAEAAKAEAAQKAQAAAAAKQAAVAA